MALDTIPKQEGGKLKAVASGTLPSGVPVVVNSDGTVSVVAGSSASADQELGSPVVFDATESRWMSSAYDANAQKIFIAYSDGNNNGYGTSVVGTVSGTSISFGTPVVFESALATYTSSTYDSAAQKVVVCYRDHGNSYNGTARVGTISGTSISFGSVAVFASVNMEMTSSVYDPISQKIVIAYRDGVNADRGTAVVGTVSGTSISFGTAVVFETGSTGDISAAYDTSVDKVVMAYKDSGNSGYGTAIVGTVSGTSISFGTAVVFESDVIGKTSTVYDANAQKILIAYEDFGAAGKAIVGTVSGTSISFGSSVTFESADSNYIAAVYDQTAQKTVISYQDAGNSNYGTLIVGTVSGTSVSFGSPVVFETADTHNIAATYDAAAEKVVVVYEDRGNSNYGTSVVFQTAYTREITNLTAENYIGMSGGVVKTLTQSQALGTESTYETGEGASVVGYDVGAKKSLLVFQDNGDSSLLKARLVTTTGTTLSYGSVVSIPGGQVGSARAIVYDTVNEKLVVFIRGNSNYPYAVVATISGDSLSFGTPVVITSVSSFPIDAAYDSTSGKIVVVYNDELKVGTVSGTSISFGSEATLNQGLNDVGLAHDPSSNKTIIVGYTSANNGKVWLGTVSGTSISIGSPTDLPINPAKIYGVFYDPPSGKIGMIIQSGPGPGEGLVATISGDTVSFGTEVEFQSGINDGSAGYDSRVNKFIVACRSINSPYPGLLRVGTISGDTFSFASPVTFNTGETAPHNNVGFDSDQGTSIIGFSDGGDSDYQKAIGFQAAGSYITRGEVADGDVATVDIVGTVSTNQLSLTAGQKYYVQTDGTIGETPADPSVLAGTAISATKMVVKS